MQPTKVYHHIILEPLTVEHLARRLRRTLSIDSNSNVSDGWLLGNATPIEIEWLLQVPAGKQGKPGYFKDKPKRQHNAYASCMRALKKRISNKLKILTFVKELPHDNNPAAAPMA